MEYFDFDEAASGSHARDDDVASDHLEIDENDAIARSDSLLQEQLLDLPDGFLGQDAPEPPMIDALDLDGVYPMVRPKEPCDFCRHMGLYCNVAKRGVMQKHGCTCCISLYRECSFTHAKAPGKFLDTLHPINENFDIPTGGLTGKKALKSLSGIAEDVDNRARKISSRLSREAVRILKTWLNDHSEHPYPNDQEKDELKLRTGLKRTQITNWLANARRRGKVRPAPRSISPIPGAIDIPRQSPRDHTLMTPLERWKYSPPENEPASTTDILRALENTSLERGRQGSSYSSHVRKTGSSNDSSHANSNIFEASSMVSSHETSRSATRSSISDLSFASAFSHRSSLGSFGSMDRKERRRRRKPSAPVNALAQHKARSSRIYQCTFCADSFQTKYDWQRHEKSLHLALEKWTCSPQGGVAFINGANRCVFCMAIDPDHDHLESLHNYSTCAEKSVAERTFYRKDHLNQHLRLMHNVKFDSSMDKWRSHTTEIISRCGFCGITLTTWKGRADHLATHFKNGADMAQWQGDWGFEPVVQSLVENAMPPYLIGYERNTPNPFKTAHAMGAPPGLSVPEDANCYSRLRRELMAYVTDHMAKGNIPTDQMIQDQGRRVIYGCDDPWNQTCADNPVWLSILKRDAGIEAVPGSESIQFENLGMQPPFASQDGLRQPPLETNTLARTVCSRQQFSAGYSSSGFQSPALPGTGQSSAAPSIPGSLAGSYSGSLGMYPTAAHSGLSTDWGSTSMSADVSTFSTPMSGSVEQFVQMGFEPEFLQRLNNQYDEELPLETFQDLNFGDGTGMEGEFTAGVGGDKVSSTTSPIPIPSLRPAEFAMPDTQ